MKRIWFVTPLIAFGIYTSFFLAVTTAESAKTRVMQLEYFVTSDCHLDIAAFNDDRRSARVAGWVRSRPDANNSSAVTAIVRAGNRTIGRATSERRVPRPDVAIHFNDPVMAESGFDVSVPLEPGALGPLTVTIVSQRSDSGAVTVCAEEVLF